MAAELPKIDTAHVLGVDVLRFVAASMVVALHLWGSQAHGEGGFVAHLLDSTLPGSRHLAPHALPSMAFIGSMGVQIFFTISGFVITYSAYKSDNWRVFLYKRMLRLAPGLWLCTIITCGIAIICGYYSLPVALVRAARSFVLSPVGPKVDDVVWTLNLEITFYCYVAILIYFRKILWIPHLAFVLSTVALLYWSLYFSFGCVIAGGEQSNAVCRIIENGYSYKITSITLVQHGSFFAFGMFLWAISEHHLDRKLALGLALSGSVCILQLIWTSRYYFWADGGLGAADKPWLVLGVWGLAMLFFAASIFRNEEILRRLRAQAGAVRTIGLATYPLYLCHGFVGGLTLAVMVRIGVTGFSAFGAALAMSTLVAVWVASALEPAFRVAIDRALLRTGLHPAGSRRRLVSLDRLTAPPVIDA